MDLFKSELTIQWLTLAWTVGGTGALYVLNNLRKKIARFFDSYPAIVTAVLGDEGKKIPSLRQIAELSEKVAQQSLEQSNNTKASCDQLSRSLLLQQNDMTALRDEVAVAISGHMHLSDSITAQGEQLQNIMKELTHNGGSSVKDMVRDSAKSSHLVLGLFRASADMADNAAHFSVDIDGAYSWTSKSYQTWTQYSQEELQGHGWINCVHFDDREAVRDEWSAAIEDHRDFYMEFRMIDSDREHFWVRMQTRKITGPNQSVLSWYGVVTRLNEEEVMKVLSTRT